MDDKTLNVVKRARSEDTSTAERELNDIGTKFDIAEYKIDQGEEERVGAPVYYGYSVSGALGNRLMQDYEVRVAMKKFIARLVDSVVSSSTSWKFVFAIVGSTGLIAYGEHQKPDGDESAYAGDIDWLAKYQV